jgi:hypothetical protein
MRRKKQELGENHYACVMKFYNVEVLSCVRVLHHRRHIGETLALTFKIKSISLDSMSICPFRDRLSQLHIEKSA